MRMKLTEEQKRNFCKKKYGNSQKRLHACFRRINPKIRKKRCQDAKIRHRIGDRPVGSLCKDAMKHEGDENEPITS